MIFEIETASGKVYEIEAPTEEMGAEVARQLQAEDARAVGAQATAEETGPVEAALVATGREFARAGRTLQRGARLVTGQSVADIQEASAAEAELLDPLARERPVATMTGATLPYLAAPQAAFSSVPRAMATGAGMGALSGEGDPQATFYGAVGGAGGRMLGQPFTPSPQARTLMAQGIQPSVGQGIAQGPLGSIVRRAEEALQSVPITGQAITRARARAQGELTQAALNRAMPGGERIPRDMPVRDALNLIRQRSSEGYDRIYGKAEFTMRPDDLRRFQAAVADPRILVPQEKRVEVAQQVADLLNLGRQQGGKYGGEAVKQAQSVIRQQAANLARSSDAEQRNLGMVYQRAGDELTKWIRRGLTPKQRRAAKDLDRAYANQLRVERAAGMLGAEEGQFTAAQLQNAVKAMAGGLRRNQFSRGQAVMQDLSEPAKTVLTGKLPESGTAPRMLTATGLGLGGVAGFDPTVAAKLATGLAAPGAAAWMTQPRAVQRYLLGGYPYQDPLATMLGRGGALTGTVLPDDPLR